MYKIIVSEFQMNTQKKKDYSSPRIELINVELEQGIASGSTYFQPGGPGSPNTPEVEDWKQDSESKDFWL